MAAGWTENHVRRLFWRAGFGPAPDDVARFTAAGRDATLHWFLNGDRGPALAGPAPTADGAPIDPVNVPGHSQLWWLDRMVRTRRPLAERMTLFWHDHFATSEQETPLMLAQNRLLRRRALGGFPRLLHDVTLDPAMQNFLSLANSFKQAPNENYARELMELFTLGGGYSERDVREAARALTGFVAIWRNGRLRGVHFAPQLHDRGVKRIFGHRGRFGWRDVLHLVCEHPRHAPFMVEKLWSHFVTEPLPSATKRKLVRVYRHSRRRVKPVLAGILADPALYADLDRPDMVKAPAVYAAGMLRATGWGVQVHQWSWLLTDMGQELFRPPSVAGWDWGPAWMSTGTVRARFQAASFLHAPGGVLHVPEGAAPVGQSAAEAIAEARRRTGNPWTSAETDAALDRLARALDPALTKPNRAQRYVDMRQRLLRQLLIAGPDAQLC